MIFIIMILIIIIIILSTYLFLINKELKSIPDKIESIKNSQSNQLMHTQYNIKNINSILIEINHLLKKSNAMALQYELKNQSLRKMMTNISHDLRTPLTSAVGYIDIILNNEMSEEERLKELKIIEERLRKLEELINSLFEFSKIVSSDNNIEMEKVNLISVLENSIIDFYDDYSKQNRMIHIDNFYRQIELDSNVMLLTRIFDNLINNAFVHSHSDLYIQVIKDEDIQIIFTNDLMNNDIDVDKMFEEFYTTDISRTNGNTGLGLAIAKEFVLRLDGQIYATKDNGQLSIIVKFKTV
ncbi:MAG: HAMP domain-containing histidine kinase [Erysipelotrichaceae bacterium]|nr:HAMP domain-containing histidine kinase [Erysipelotrichaceae bacterium]